MSSLLDDFSLSGLLEWTVQSVYRCTESASNLKEEYRSSGQIGTSDVMSSQ